jgi:hypothetical protein
MLELCSGGSLLQYVRIEDGLDEFEAKPLFR